MSEASQIVAGVVILQQNDLAQHQAFLARPFGRFTAIQFWFSIAHSHIMRSWSYDWSWWYLS